MKVKIGFYCIQEKKTYKIGDEYTGKRKDLGHLLEQSKKKNAAPKTQNKNGTPKTKNK